MFLALSNDVFLNVNNIRKAQIVSGVLRIYYFEEEPTSIYNKEDQKIVLNFIKNNLYEK